MRLIAVLVAAVAAYVWFKRRRRALGGVEGPPGPLRSVPMPAEPTTEHEGAAATSSGDDGDSPVVPREDTGGLDASAGWDDAQGGPAAQTSGSGQEHAYDARRA